MERKKKHNTKYSPEFKKSVIMDMRENHLAYRETVRKYWNTRSRAEEDLYVHTVKKWECIYLTEGAEGFMTERRGRGSKGRPRKKPLPTEVENDLIAENQRLKERNEYLEMELEYLKKTRCLSSSGRGTERQKAKIVSDICNSILNVLNYLCHYS